ncbi:MAG TPA: serine hydrolase [Vicinamibacterales bacterium]|nr:serine hydrolase [Vicinamibacterales bacterium]
MTSTTIRRILVGLCAMALAGTAVLARPAAHAASRQDRTARVDALFARWTTSTPGCAVGVGQGGQVVLARAYGMADLERDVPNTPDTIFEAGSVSKQFTAAAVLALVDDGRLTLDDPVRQYVPELPDYGTPLTIRHMLTHTSGLRDWGSLASISGWPRGDRRHTHAHVVDILSRQRALNFAPGTRWSYSNSGYNLAAVIVARVSGMSFAEFSHARLFEPLGLTSTSWRDDYTRIVPKRAVAYAAGRGGGPFRLNMPFEDVHGNGGLLTTVGDLVRWNEHYDNPPPGAAARVARQHEAAVLTGGQTLEYAYGIYVRPYKGVREVSHSGSTAGYRAFLTRFPGERLSVAVLCNAASANPTQLAHAVADLYLGARANPDAPAPSPVAETRGPTSGLARDAAFKPTASDLAAYAGTYTSDEVETTLTVEVRDGGLVITGRPDRVIRLQPHSGDRFDAAGLGLVTFHRAGGRVTAFGVTQDRVWDLRFTRQ